VMQVSPEVHLQTIICRTLKIEELSK